MDPLELLLRGVAALLVMAIVAGLARLRFRTGRDAAAPADIGLD